jgi:hypothetical protein
MKKQTLLRVIMAGLSIGIVLIIAACGRKNAAPVETAFSPELPEDVDSLVVLAKFDLTLKTGVDLEKITTKSIKETLFDDSSLGIPQPGVEYEAVVTPGYIITLEAGGKSYEYHASGEKVLQVPLK